MKLNTLFCGVGNVKMKLVKIANGKNKIKISRSEWTEIGKKAGWLNKTTVKEKRPRKKRDYNEEKYKRWKENYDQQRDDDIDNTVANLPKAQIEDFVEFRSQQSNGRKLEKGTVVDIIESDYDTPIYVVKSVSGKLHKCRNVANVGEEEADEKRRANLDLGKYLEDSYRRQREEGERADAEMREERNETEDSNRDFYFD